ncbi:MAG: hypothetical protein K2H11_03685, partial [Malacoplasma sp.]|nr:hypothetical protein [Malacoplasma sp.]
MTDKMLFSLFSFPLVALPIGLATLNNSNNSISLVNKSLNDAATTTVNPEDALAVSDVSIKSFGDYIVSYEDNNVSPVNVTIPLPDNNQAGTAKAGGATVGMTANKQTITVTTYAGLLLWSHKLTDNQLLKTYYSTVKSVTDISKYKVVNFAFLESKNILFVLFGEETTVDSTTTLSNLVVFGLDISSGAIIVPSSAELSQNQIIRNVEDKSAFIFFNSADELVVTSGNDVVSARNTTKIISFDKKSTGFGEPKSVNIPVGTTKNQNKGVVNTLDYFLGYMPSDVEGVNFSLWLYYSSSNNSADLSYATGKNSPNNTLNSNYKNFNYYVLVTDDNFNFLSSYNVVNRSGNANSAINQRGYISSSSESTLPDFNSITKRFFNTGSVNNGGTVSESMGILLDSYDSMFASFVNYSVSIDSTAKTVASVKYDIFMNYGTSATTIVDSGPKADDLTALGDNKKVAEWEFNSVGYDKESNFVYFSLSGNEYEIGKGSDADTIIDGKYLTNTKYIDLRSTTTTDNVITDSYVEADPYTLSDVNFNTYSSNNLYLVKQTIDGNEGNWLSSKDTDFNKDDVDFQQTGNINFSSLETFISDVQNSESLNDVMPSALNNNLNSLDKFLTDKKWTDNIKFIGATGNDETGEISLQTEITYANNFGDTDTNNGSVTYVSNIQVVGFTKNDFVWSFKQDSQITDITSKYSAEAIVKEDNKGWVITNLLNDITIKGKKFIPQNEDIILKNTNSDTLEVEITVPIKQSPSDEKGVLPVGFTGNNKLTKNFKFTGNETPPFIDIPTNPDNPGNNQNSGDGLSAGAIAGIVIGCLALAAIIIAAIVLIRIRTKSKV